MEPKIRFGFKKVSLQRFKKCFVGPVGVIFACRCRKMRTLREPNHSLCFKLLLCVLARPFSLQQRSRACNMHQQFFLLSLSANVCRQSEAPGRLKVGPGAPKAATRMSKDTLGTATNSDSSYLRPHQFVLGCSWGFPAGNVHKMLQTNRNFELSQGLIWLYLELSGKHLVRLASRLRQLSEVS